MTRLSITIIITIVLITSVSMAEVPPLISYQGRITDSLNNPIADGTYEITISRYDVETGGVPFWAETLNTVAVQNGLFNVILGATTPFGGSAVPMSTLFNSHATKRAGSSFWLGIKVGTNPEFTPRSQLLSVPFAFNADWSDSQVEQCPCNLGNSR